MTETHPEEQVDQGGGRGAAPSPVSAVTDVRGTDVGKLLAPRDGGGYADIVDYIVRITHEIWEEGNLGHIYDHYLHNLTLHTSDGLTQERDKVLADSFKTFAAFPNLRLYADDVIWGSDAHGGFGASHRITWSGRNTGYSVYGPPTGRPVVRQGIAHCYVKDDVIVEEWICRDELALVQQLGRDLVLRPARPRRAHRTGCRARHAQHRRHHRAGQPQGGPARRPSRHAAPARQAACPGPRRRRRRDRR